MRYESCLYINFYSYLKGNKNIFSDVGIKKIATACQYLTKGMFIPKSIQDEIKVPFLSSDKLIYTLDDNAKSYIPKDFNSYRDAFQFKSVLFLVFATKKQENVYKIIKELPDDYHYEEIVYNKFKYVFYYCENTYDNVCRLRSNKWTVKSPKVDKIPKLDDTLEKYMNPNLFPYQVEGVKMLNSGYRLLADEMGLGKTVQALQYMKLMDFKKVLICCPATLKLNWREEIVNVWKFFKDEEVHIISGGTNYELKNKRIYIINYDLLSKWETTLCKVKWDFVCCDECHYIQNRKSLRTKSFLKISKKSADTLFISGTPFTSRPIQMYTALHTIAPNIFKNENNYGMIFCGPKLAYGGYMSRGYNSYEFKGSSNPDQLHQIIKCGICIRRLKKDVLEDLPDKMRVTVFLESKKTAEDSRMIKELLDKKMENPNPLSDFEYSKQMAYYEKRAEIINWIENFLESGKKLVVFATHKVAINDIMNHFKGISVKLDGSTSIQDRQIAVNRFQTDDKIRLFVGNTKAAGTGITLTAASDTCTIEFSFLCSDHLQAEDRVHRVGQKNAVTSYYLICKNSVEELIIRIINQKAKVQSKIFDDKEDNIMLLVNEAIKKGEK